MVASEKLTGEQWHSVQQDVLLTLDPYDVEEPRAERLVGDAVLARARIEKFEAGDGAARRGTRNLRGRAGRQVGGRVDGPQ